MTKEVSVQCSLLPAPPLCFEKNRIDAVDTFGDDDAVEELDDSDTDYKYDSDSFEE